MPKQAVSKIDPKSFLQPQADVAAWTPPGMEKMVAAPPKETKPPEEPPRQKMDVSHLDIPKVEDPYKKAIPDDLVTQLCEELGFLPPSELRKAVVQVGPKTLELEVRALNFADQTWMWGEYPNLVRDHPDLTNTPVQTNDMIEALMACRALVKINGKFIWDRLNYRSAIIAASPTWDGVSYQDVPSTFLSQMAVKVFKSFLKLDPRILSALASFMKEDRKTDDEENPTEAT
jgi:hypothetical protein